MAGRMANDVVANSVSSVALYVSAPPEYPTDLGKVVLSNSSNQLRLAANSFTTGATTISVLPSTAEQKITIQNDIGDCQLVTTKGNFTILGNITFSGTVSLPVGAISLSSLDSDIVPNVTTTYNLGSPSKYFLSAYITNLYTNTTIAVETLRVSDAIVEIGSGNGIVGDAKNMGFTAEYKNSGVKYGGLIRSSADGIWKLFKDASPIPTEVTDFSAISRGDLDMGALTATSITSSTINIGTTALKTTISQSLTSSRIFTLPDANSVSVVPSSGTSGQFATGISAGGVISYSTPAFSGISGTVNLATQATGVLPIANGGTNSSTALVGNRLIRSNASSIIEADELTDGQLFIGSTGVAPIAATLTGTTNQINIVSAAGSITLSTPQNIATTSTPTFASATFSNSTNMLTLGTTNTYTVTMAALSASRTLTLPNANSVAVIPSSASANQFATGISSGGVISYSQPTFSGISGTVNLATQVTGALPIANGGTNSSTALTGGKFIVSNVGATQIVEGTSSTSPTFTSVILTSGIVNNNNIALLTLPSTTDTLVGTASADTFTGIKRFSTAPVFTAASNHFSIRSNDTGNSMIFTAATPATADRTVTFPDPINAAPNVAYWDSAGASFASMVQNRGATPTFYLKSSSGAAQLIVDSAGADVRHVLGISGTMYWNLECMAGTNRYRIFDRTASAGVGKEHFTILQQSTTAVGINTSTPGTTLDVVGNIRASTQISCTSSTDSTSVTTGSIVAAGGIGCTKNLYCGSNIVFPSGGASNLNWYQESTASLDFADGGAFASTWTATVRCTRIGRMVVIFVSEILQPADATPATTTVSSTGVASVFYPSSTVSAVISTTNAGIHADGNVQVSTTGILTIYASSNRTSTWGASGTNGWRAFSICYSV
jgi:hypothetical protein